MTQISKAFAEAKRDAWMETEDALTSGLTIDVGGRSLTRVDLPQVRNAINYWAGVVEQFDTAARSTTRNHGFRVADFRC